MNKEAKQEKKYLKKNKNKSCKREFRKKAGQADVIHNDNS